MDDAQNDEFQQILKASNLELMEQRRSAMDWIRDLINKLRNPSRRVSQLKPIQKSARPEIGKMYLYSYDPKHKDTLPIYDMFPLVIPIDYYSDGFLGLNLHYLPEQARIVLLRELVKVANNDKFDRTTKINISYRILKKMSLNLTGANGTCIKRYLYGHVRSGFQQVDASEWSKAALLPLAKWVVNKNPKLR